MAGPRERSRHRGMERQNKYYLQNIRTPDHSRTAESPSAHSNDSYDERNHGHPQYSRAQRLDRTILQTCKERLVGALRTGKDRSAGFMTMCKAILVKQRITTIITASTVCVLFICGLWAFRGLNRRDERSDYGLAPTITITRTRSSTTYITLTVHYNQFHGARPVHHQAPMAIPSNVEATGQLIPRDLSRPHAVTATSSPVPGLYFIPVSMTNGGWPQTQQDSRSSSRFASNTGGSQIRQGSPNLGNSEPEVEPLLQSREIGVPRDLIAGQADEETAPSTRWGVDVLYGLRPRSRRSIHFYKAWCIENACSPHKKLSSICNTTKTISDSLRKQECDWCWPENQRKHQTINDHCTEVSKRALNAMLIICGIFLLCTLVVALVMARQITRRWRVAKADGILHKHVTTSSPLQEKTNSVVPSHWFSHSMSKIGRSSEAGRIRVDNIAIKERSPGETICKTSWYESVLAKLWKHSETGSENARPGRFGFQKQRPKPLGQEITFRDGDSLERIPVLPPAPPAIISRVFSDIENMGQERLLSGQGTNESQHDAPGTPHRSLRQSRAISSGSEQSASVATHRRDVGAASHNLQRLTERS